MRIKTKSMTEHKRGKEIEIESIPNIVCIAQRVPKRPKSNDKKRMFSHQLWSPARDHDTTTKP